MYAYLIVEVDAAKLFVDNSKVTPEVMDHLRNAGVELRPYDSILSEIRRYVLGVTLILHLKHFALNWAFFHAYG